MCICVHWCASLQHVMLMRVYWLITNIIGSQVWHISHVSACVSISTFFGVLCMHVDVCVCLGLTCIGVYWFIAMRLNLFNCTVQMYNNTIAIALINMSNSVTVIWQESAITAPYLLPLIVITPRLSSTESLQYCPALVSKEVNLRPGPAPLSAGPASASRDSQVSVCGNKLDDVSFIFSGKCTILR